MFILDKIGMGLTMRMAETADTEISYNINYTVLDINEENMGRSSIQGIMDIEYMEPLELTSSDNITKIIVNEILLSNTGGAEQTVRFGIKQPDGSRVFFLKDLLMDIDDVAIFGENYYSAPGVGTVGGGSGSNSMTATDMEIDARIDAKVERFALRDTTTRIGVIRMPIEEDWNSGAFS